MATSSGNTPAIKVTELSKTFNSRPALQKVDLQVDQGEMVALIGPSGSGKSTLLRHMSGLVAGDRGRGSIHILGQAVQTNGRIASDIRKTRASIGFIFQQFNLVGRMSLLENVLVGRLAQIPRRRSLLRWFTLAEKRAAMVSLQRVGLSEYATQRASTLSGGQQQRASIARAMLQRANIILADEPIASLDPESARLVMEGLSTLNREDSVTVLVSLHQVQFALQYCPRTVALRDGQTVYDGPSKDVNAALLRQVYGSKFSEFAMDGTKPLRASDERPTALDRHQSISSSSCAGTDGTMSHATRRIP